MSKEIEIKVLNIDVEEIKEKLLEIGAIKVKEEIQQNIVFDTDDCLSKNGIDGYLRVRSVEDLISNEEYHEFTLKKKLCVDETSRVHEEIETRIEKPEVMVEIMKAVGIEVLHRGEKKRVSYKFEEILFEIDIWDEKTYPDPYMEIEVCKNEDLERAVRLLDLNESQLTTKSINTLRKEKNLK